MRRMGKMPTGAHCRDCLVNGPDLHVNAQPSLAGTGARVRVEFVCGGCGKHVAWNAIFPGHMLGTPVYSFVSSE